jgi:2,5-furandicarboxylate decarboxylase 1
MTDSLRPTVPPGEDMQSLRYFLGLLQPEERISITARREDYLLSAIVEQLEREKKFPVVELTDPDTGRLTICNTFGNRKILERFLHNVVDVEERADDFNKLEYVDKAPVQEVVFTGDQVDLTVLPIFRHFEDDAGRYITSGVVIAKDPDTGRCNFSFHRMQIKGKNRIGISLHSRGDLWNYLNTASKNGKNLEIAVMIGNHPAYYITGASKIPPSQDDYSWAAAYMGENAKVICAKTVDIPVPAFAEYILEGSILTDINEDEGPFGEYTGYSTSRSTRNVFVVSAITHRRDPVYQDLVPGYTWEHLLLSQFTKEIILLNKLQKEIPGIRALNMPKNGCHFHAYLSMDAKARGQARQAMMLLFGLDIYLKMIITVDEDVDVFNEEEVLWAMATHVQADRDVFVVSDVLCNRLDPSSSDGVSAKMGIDATSEPGHREQRTTLPPEVLAQAKKLIKKEEDS